MEGLKSVADTYLKDGSRGWSEIVGSVAGGIVYPWSPGVHTWQVHMFSFKLVARLERPVTSEASQLSDWKEQTLWCLAVEVDNSIFLELFSMPSSFQLGEGITGLLFSQNPQTFGQTDV